MHIVDNFNYCHLLCASRTSAQVLVPHPVLLPLESSLCRSCEKWTLKLARVREFMGVRQAVATTMSLDDQVGVANEQLKKKVKCGVNI